MKKMLKTILKIVLATLILFVCYVVYVFNVESWQELATYSIRIKGDSWQPLDIQQQPNEQNYRKIIEYDLAIPGRYRLQSKDYDIEIIVRPLSHRWQLNFQLLATHKLDARLLEVESDWTSPCGIVGQVEAENRNDWIGDEYLRSFEEFPFSTNPQAFEFLWHISVRPDSVCLPTDEFYQPPTPINIDIYDGTTLIGQEQIDFDIIQSGLHQFMVPF